MHMNLKYGYIITEPGADFKRFFQGFPSVIGYYSWPDRMADNAFIAVPGTNVLTFE